MGHQQETQRNRGHRTSCLTQATTLLHFRLSVLYNKPNSCTYITLNVLRVITNPENPTLNSPSQAKSTEASSVFQGNFVSFFFPSLNPFNPLVQAISFTNISCNQGLAHVVIFPLINQSILSVECFFSPLENDNATSGLPATWFSQGMSIKFARFCFKDEKNGIDSQRPLVLE